MDYILQSKGSDWLNEFKNNYPRVPSPNGPIGHSWLHFPSQEKQLTTIYKQDTADRLLEHGDEAETFPCTVETKMDCIRRGREQVHTDHMALPLGQCSTVQREFLFLQWEKRVLGTTSTPSIVSCSVGTSTLYSPNRQL